MEAIPATPTPAAAEVPAPKPLAVELSEAEKSLVDVISAVTALTARVSALETAHLSTVAPDATGDWHGFVSALKDDLAKVKSRIWGE